MKVLIASLKGIVALILIYMIYIKVGICLTNLLLVVIFLLLSDIAQSVIHEFGHLIGGLLSKHHLLLMHIGIFELRKCEIDSKKFKIVMNSDILNQCLMIPKTTNKYMLYNLGGILFNFIMTLISLAFLCFNYKIIDSWLFVALTTFVAIGVIKILGNTLPTYKKNMPNDMQIVKMLSASKKTLHDYLIYLRAYERAMFNLPFEYEGKNTDFSDKDIKYYNPFFAKAIKSFSQTTDC